MSFVRRSERLNTKHSQNANSNRHSNPMFTGYNAQQNQAQYLREEGEKLYDRQRYCNTSPQTKEEPEAENMVEPKIEVKTEPNTSTEIELKNEKVDVAPAETSATKKALNKMEVDGGEKKKWKKGNKLPLSIRRKKLNQRLSKILAPKSALILLHELKPGCVYKVQEQQGVTPVAFTASVEYKGVFLGMGQGLSKSQAKNEAAENAIKAIVSKTMSQSQDTKKEEEGNGGEAMEQDENYENLGNLPWAGLASFAIYKMFSDWQNQGTDLPLTKPVAKVKAKGATKAPTSKKDLPPNASDLHPTVLLNIMKPGLTAVEVDRESGPKCKVTMVYTIDGKAYAGVGGNKKDAKKEAAKAVVSSLYGLTYPS